jgi:hypothetical protein
MTAISVEAQRVFYAFTYTGMMRAGLFMPNDAWLPLTTRALASSIDPLREKLIIYARMRMRASGWQKE